jgi:purine nucleosidase
MEFHDAYQKIEGCAINDPLALALVFQPDLVTWEDLYVDVDTNAGASIGKTFADFYNYSHKEPNMRVAMKVRANDFLDLFVDRMETLCRQFPD